MRATDRRWLAGRCSWVHACVQIRYDTVARPSCRRVRGADSIKQDDVPDSLSGVDSQIGPQFFDDGSGGIGEAVSVFSEAGGNDTHDPLALA